MWRPLKEGEDRIELCKQARQNAEDMNMQVHKRAGILLQRMIGDEKGSKSEKS
jgi:hypothetical protein